MKPVNKTLLSLAIFLIVGASFSCEKKVDCANCNNSGLPPAPFINHPPIARAGADQLIILPVNNTILNGTSSSDPDNDITNYSWTKILGPLSFNIANSNTPQTEVINLVKGIYLFELKVTDAGGMVSKDTVEVSVWRTGSTEIIFTDQVLINTCYDPSPGACWINGDSPSYGLNISDNANILPDSAMAISGVWIRMDTSSVWENVPHNCWQFPEPTPQTNFIYCITPNNLSIWTWFFSLKNLEGRKANVRIVY
ncbi:MAG: hypothetical protein ABIT05_00215 [Chitinophagaceae bacterium]